MTDQHDAEIAKLKAKLASLENLREDLGPATFDAKTRAIQARLQTLVQTAGGTFVVHDVGTDGGDFVGRDQYNIRIEAGAYVGERPQTRERRLEIYRGVLAARTGELPLRGFDPEGRRRLAERLAGPATGGSARCALWLGWAVGLR